MTRRLLLLNGLAIVGVVCGHSAGWGFIAMFQWADRYRAVAAPNYDQVGSLPYYALVATRCLSSFSVPAFLFVTGFFVAYAARGVQSTVSWKLVGTRLRSLLVPYLLWSVVVFASEALQGITDAPLQYVKRLLLGRAHPAYFYVPLLCQFYLLAPLITPIARTRPSLLLLSAALLQLLVLGSRYLVVLGVEASALVPVTDLLFPMYGLFFGLGVVAGHHLQALKLWLAKARWCLLGALVALAVLSIAESEVVYRLTGLRRGAGPTTLPTALYGLAFILCFLAFDQAPLPLSKSIYGIGGASFGIYLLHTFVLEFVSRAIQRFSPWVLAYQALFQAMLVAFAILGPLLLMSAVARSPTRRLQSYLFGRAGRALG